MKNQKSKNLFFTAIAAVLMAAFIGGCKKDKYVPLEGACPIVLSTNPANTAVSVPLNQTVTVTFNVKMNPTTITQAAFTLMGASKIAGAITYNELNSTMSFVPTGGLTPNTTYTGRVATTVKDQLGNALQTDYVWSFSTGATLTPMVVITDPANGEIGVVVNKTITADFNMAMDPLTINATNFIVKQGATNVAGTVSYNGTTASFAPTSPLAINTIYTATITTGAKSTASVSIASNFTWSFTTGSTSAPIVVSTDPTNNSSNVVTNKVITATFSEPMDALTINAASFLLKTGITTVAGTISYAGTTASFTPSSNLLPGTAYSATITTGAKNPSAISIANNYVWTFTTVAVAVVAPSVIATSPTNNATGVALNKVVTATFNEAMDALTLTGATFILKQGVNTVAGNVTYAGTTASFTPTSALLSGTVYNATITTGAKNLAGTPIASNYVWSFTTVLPLGPPVVDLKTVARFGIIAGVGVSNNAGFSEIHDMDVGISPGVLSSVTGFPPAIVVNGAIYASDDLIPVGTPAMLIQAKQDLTDAYLFAEGAVSPAPTIVAADLGGMTLAPGIYKSTSTLLIQNGNLTLDAQGDVNAVWIFQIASAFTTVGGAGGSIILSGGAQAKNIFWQTGSSATIGDFTAFKGNILALTSITMNSGATAVGRMLCRNGAVVLTSTNIINKP